MALSPDEFLEEKTKKGQFLIDLIDKEFIENQLVMENGVVGFFPSNKLLKEINNFGSFEFVRMSYKAVGWKNVEIVSGRADPMFVFFK